MIKEVIHLHHSHVCFLFNFVLHIAILWQIIQLCLILLHAILFVLITHSICLKAWCSPSSYCEGTTVKIYVVSLLLLYVAPIQHERSKKLRLMVESKTVGSKLVKEGRDSIAIDLLGITINYYKIPWVEWCMIYTVTALNFYWPLLILLGYI